MPRPGEFCRTTAWPCLALLERIRGTVVHSDFWLILQCHLIMTMIHQSAGKKWVQVFARLVRENSLVAFVWTYFRGPLLFQTLVPCVALVRRSNFQITKYRCFACRRWCFPSRLCANSFVLFHFKICCLLSLVPAGLHGYSVVWAAAYTEQRSTAQHIPFNLQRCRTVSLILHSSVVLDETNGVTAAHHSSWAAAWHFTHLSRCGWILIDIHWWRRVAA